jgi:hypothetical protein
VSECASAPQRGDPFATVGSRRAGIPDREYVALAPALSGTPRAGGAVAPQPHGYRSGHPATAHPLRSCAGTGGYIATCPGSFACGKGAGCSQGAS